VDGFRGLEANYGTMYQVADIRGISPLFFTPARDLIYRGDPRPFALLLYQADVVDSDAFANALLNDSQFDPRSSVIVQGDLGLTLPDEPGQGTAIVTDYQPESFTIEIETDENAVLSLAQIAYPGWKATLDDESVPLLRAYGGLTAVVIPEGTHTLHLVYDPTSYKIGAIFSAITWALLAVWGVIVVIRKR
jgi:hypothetical protein